MGSFRKERTCARDAGGLKALTTGCYPRPTETSKIDRLANCSAAEDRAGQLATSPCSGALAALVVCQKVGSGRFRSPIPDTGLNVFQQQDADDFITVHLLQILS